MSTSANIRDYIARSTQSVWEPLFEKGIQYEGIFVKSLRYDAASGRSKTILLKFEPGAVYPYHNHPGGEEVFVLDGSVLIEGTLLEQGDYLYTPPGFRHAVTTATGCTLLFVVPEEVEIL
jgi:quercetin dioxygenase-like cupin family protein